MRSRNDESPVRGMTLKEQRMCAKELAEMRNQMLRETQVFLNLHLNDRVPRFHDEPSLP